MAVPRNLIAWVEKTLGARRLAQFARETTPTRGQRV